MQNIGQMQEYVNSPAFKETLHIPAAHKVELEELAKGEYNINYTFDHPVTGQKLVFRLNTASQMHLENQIDYEYNALKLLERSTRTPKPLFVDGSKEKLDYGVLVMEYIKGRPLCYETDLDKAALILSDIHSVKIGEKDGLVCPANPLGAMLDECNAMVETYYQSDLGDLKIKKRIEELLSIGTKKVEAFGNYNGYKCCVNTELNSHNFLMSLDRGVDHLVDWEKPIYGDPAQDLGHFLAPTTTFWKTDTILNKCQMKEFVKKYVLAADDRFDTHNVQERVDIFVPVNCLRGITWSAMAWVEYQQPGRLIKNEFTFKKMCSYLDLDFLEGLHHEFFS